MYDIETTQALELKFIVPFQGHSGQGLNKYSKLMYKLKTQAST